MNKTEYKDFCSQLELVIIKYPSLNIRVGKDSRLYLKGVLDIPNEDQIVVGSYLIEIHFNESFPFRFPILYETGESIPNEFDWHKYPDGKCCITVLPDEIIKCKHGITVLEFLETYAFSFFANHIYRKLTGSYFNGEYSHGSLGLKEFYTELLKTNSIRLWAHDYKHCFSLSNLKIGRNDKCFCGSHSKFKHCHFKIYKCLYEVGSQQVLRDFTMMNIPLFD